MSITSVHYIIEELTKKESGKIIAVLTRVFGPHNFELAEDVFQDVLIKALESWQEKGVPDNPTAWLYRAAKNRAIDMLRKYRHEYTYGDDHNPLLDSEYTANTVLEDYFKEHEIKDDQLRMIFACCHPDIAKEAQTAMVLKTISGFSIPQIAKAFITSKDTIEKRLYRARKAFRDGKVAFTIPTGDELIARLENVLKTIYLIFNESYSSSYDDELIKESLALDTIRLCTLIVEHPSTCRPEARALLALCYFHTARMPGRISASGDLLLMSEQNRSLWNKDFIDAGIHQLTLAAEGSNISRYHVEAAIAYEHCKAETYDATDWRMILEYYNILQQIEPSPIILLNRAVVLKELEGAAKAIEVIKSIPGINYLDKYYLLHAILGKLYSEIGSKIDAIKHFEKALSLVVSTAERKLINKELKELTS
ncbi:MAG: sigma-70 family RNA polymerase sigma factor [Flavipsychrobacter sp.]